MRKETKVRQTQKNARSQSPLTMESAVLLLESAYLLLSFCYTRALLLSGHSVSLDLGCC